MEETVAVLTTKVRKALDDIAPSVADSFSNDVDAEIEQALLHAAELVTMEAPVQFLVPTVKLAANASGEEANSLVFDSTNHKLTLPQKAIRLIELKMTDWAIALTEFLDPSSDEAKMQRTSWGCGTPDKPKAVVAFNDKMGTSPNTTGRLDVYYWSSDSNTLGHVAYVERPEIKEVTESQTTVKKLFCAVKDILQKNIVYRACQIFLEGKQERETADKFAALAQIA